MSNFHTAQMNNSKHLLSSLPLSPAMPGVRRAKDKNDLLDTWPRSVCDNAKLHIKCDLTMKHSVMLFCPSPYAENKMYLNEDLAFANIGQFAERLNYAIYKNAYRRYGKRLDMVCAIEGGKYVLRDTPKKGHREKRFHAHLLLQYPNLTYYRFDGKGTVFTKALFMDIIEECWLGTMFGYNENKIEVIENKFGAVKYCGKDGLDSIRLEDTHIA